MDAALQPGLRYQHQFLVPVQKLFRRYTRKPKSSR